MPFTGTITIDRIGPRQAPIAPTVTATPSKGALSMGITLQSKAIKASVVLDPAAVATIPAPPGQPKVTLRVAVGAKSITAELNAKSVRKVIGTIAEAGPKNVVVIVQGKLEGDVLVEAGIVAQLKTPKPAAGAAA